jgi:glutaredoxin 3
MNTTATVYSKPNCPFCVDAIALLKKHNIPCREIKLGRDIESRDDFIAEITKLKGEAPETVPQIFLSVGGFDDLVALMAK